MKPARLHVGHCVALAVAVCVARGAAAQTQAQTAAAPFPPPVAYRLIPIAPPPRHYVADRQTEATRGTETTVTVTVARPTAAPLAPIPHPGAGRPLGSDPDLNPARRGECREALSTVGGQPASAADLAGAAGRSLCRF